MPKRITYLTKRSDLSAEQFSAHWSTSHAAIAVNLPGIESYRQNHVVGGGSSVYNVDGIVELWFANDDVVAAGIDSEVANLLVEDEPRFLSGLVGGAVDAGPPTPHWPHKIWLLARWAARTAPEQLSEWALQAASRTGVFAAAVNTTDLRGPQLSRDCLTVNPRPPQIAVCFGLRSGQNPEAVRGTVQREAKRSDIMVDPVALIAEEKVIV